MSNKPLVCTRCGGHAQIELESRKAQAQENSPVHCGGCGAESTYKKVMEEAAAHFAANALKDAFKGSKMFKPSNKANKKPLFVFGQ